MNPTPENRSIPVYAWPDIDRRSWIAANTPRDIFDAARSTASEWSEITRAGVAEGYGQWLNWLVENDPTCLSARPADRAIKDRLRAYHNALDAQDLADYTVAGRIRSVSNALEAIEPAHDWSWIERVANHLHSIAEPRKNIHEILQPASKVLDLGMALMESAAAEGQGSTAGGYNSVRFRDGLMIAFLILCPLRRRNLVSLSLGHNLEKRADGWHIRIPGEETKTGREIVCRWPEMLDDALEQYLTVHRPALLGQRMSDPACTDALWISRQRRKMSSQAIYETICDRTEAAFGRAVYPHAFRHIAATTIATLAPEQTDLIMHVLGHVSRQSADKYYNKARMMGAAERMNATRAKVRRELRVRCWREAGSNAFG